MYQHFSDKHPRFRGTLNMDPCHRRPNWADWNIRRHGLSEMKLETGLLISVRKGPFRGSGNKHKLQSTMKNYYATRCADDPVFRFMYEDIVRALSDGILPAGFGSEGHIASTFERTKLCPFWHTSGVQYKRARWSDWHHNIPVLI